MFLSNKNTLKLDSLVKSFEVAYRSYISKKIINQFQSEDEFLDVIESIEIPVSSLINSGAHNSKLKNMKREYKEIYKSIKFSYESITNFNDSNSIEETRNDVLYVSQLIDIITFLTNPYFNNLYKKFETKDQFIYYSSIYKNIRNDLSHPASAKISFSDTQIIIKYIQYLLDVIDDDCFWYIKKDDIKKNIVSLNESMSNIPTLINNLNEIATQHNKVIGRSKELETLNKWILGEEGSYRTANSIVTYGYGGIGKTTLVVEFIYELFKKIADEEVDKNYKYILFFSSKSEKLKFAQTSGNIYIENIRQQISSFDDFKNSLCHYLEIEDQDNIYKYLNQHEGIIVIDNIENLHNKDLLIDFIKRSPRSVQYIVTSRNEEMCEEKLNILGFDERNNGLNFIDEYIAANNFDLCLNNKNKHDLIKSAVGNTLIIVTSLERIQSGKSTIDSIINELMNVNSLNTQQIADFMYKNTFNQTLEELREYNVESLLRVIALYEEPIDLYAMSELTNMSIKNLEEMCEILSRKLVLYKAQDLYTLNDFASKFIFSKILLDEIELNAIIHKIKDYKQKIQFTLEKVDKIKSENKFLENVMNDWKPQNNTEKLAIANAFLQFNDTYKYLTKLKKQLTSKNKKQRAAHKVIIDELANIENIFKNFELKTCHPYIKYQKARIYKLFIELNICGPNARKIILEKIKQNFEDTKFYVEMYYQYIKNTESYAAFLWIYGGFLKIYIKDYTQALSILSTSKQVFMKLSLYNSSYFKLCNDIVYCYCMKYNDLNEPLYLDKAKIIYNEVLDLEAHSIEDLDPNIKPFDFERFKKDFDYLAK